MKTIKFRTLGCKVNQYETQSIREQFIGAGFKEKTNGQPASVYVINTCTVTHKADKESLYYIHRAYRENPRAKIIVTGCLTELDSQLIARQKGVSLIVRNKDKHKIPKLINIHNENNGTNDLNDINDTNEITISSFKGHTRAFLKIQDGCDNCCSYCKVPLVRNKLVSKPLDLAIQEAASLVNNGFKEIVLTGICLGAYGRDLGKGIDLGKVIKELEKIPGLLRIRLSSIEAGDISEDLIAKISESKKLCHHLHIPVQSGDNQVLKRMNRKYNRQDYLGLIQKIKRRIPDIAITTDVLVGFPGETEDNFQNTVDLIKRIIPLKAHIFPYSPRKGTLAFSFKQDLSPQAIKERLSYLGRVCQDSALIYQRQFINKTREVLIEGKAKEKPGFWQGHADNYLQVLVKSKRNLKNKIVSLKLKSIINGCFLATIDK